MTKVGNRPGAPMFRMLRLKPPHGWNAVAWELGIVTLGVLIALGVQQWADGRETRERTGVALSAIRGELTEHYSWAFEFRVVAPCIDRQIEIIEKRVMESGTTLEPTQIINGLKDYTIQGPSKDYNSFAYDEAQGEGLVAGMEPETRSILQQHYGQARSMRNLTMQSDAIYSEMLVLAKPIPLDASVRAAIIQKLSLLRGQVQFTDIIAGQLIDYINRLNMVPTMAEARRVTTSYNTYNYCRAKGLPMRSFEEARVPLAG